MAEHKSKKVKIAKSTFYMITSVVLAVALIISVGINLTSGSGTSTAGIGKDNAAASAVDFINNNCREKTDIY